MVQIPEPQHTTAALIFKHYENTADAGLRPHLGASLIGHECKRYLWNTFHWVEKPSWSGRMYRLFETGKLEEARIIQNLQMIGCEVSDTTPDGDQHRVSAVGGHFGGSLDALVKRLPEAPEAEHVAEFKTHNDKSFKDLVANGVEKSKPMHYAQMQTYMGLRELSRALYFAVNKNTDEIYTERVKFDKVAFAKIMERAVSVITSPEPPEKISEDAAWWQCKGCQFAAQCHGTAAPLVNCRTCAHSTPDVNQDGGVWVCERYRAPIPDYQQRIGCPEHRYIPILLRNFGEMVDANTEANWVEYQNKATGKRFWNGDLSSQEIRACQDKRILGDEGMAEFRREFKAEVIG